jgi:tRNA nucleotidyltransferase (CCA-adding enzyme)
MCQSQAQGGRRCEGSPTGRDRARLARRARTGSAAAADRLARFDAARARYGNTVTVMDLPVPDSVTQAFTVLQQAGFRPLVVGGSVRDALVDGRTPKDIDVEVFGASIDDVARVLRARYRVDEVGRRFGVLKVTLPDRTDLDVSVPRRDNRVGAGHRGFEVEMDADMTVADAAWRRDFTVNALSFDPEYGVCVDPYGGRADLNARILRHVGAKFDEDPNRVLRGVQFAARYAMTMDPDTAALCRSLLPRVSEVPVEPRRIEWGKVYAKGTEPSRALQVLAQTGWDASVPGLPAVVTDERLHAQADRAVQVALADGVGVGERAALVTATIARRMPSEQARAFVRETVEGGNAQRAAYALSQAQAPTAAAGRSDTVVRRWARELGRAGTSVRAWARLARVTGTGTDAEVALFTETAARLGCLDSAQPDLIQGRDVLPRYADRKPGPWVGAVVDAARDAQEHGEFTDAAGAQRWLDAHTPA